MSGQASTSSSSATLSGNTQSSSSNIINGNTNQLPSRNNPPTTPPKKSKQFELSPSNSHQPGWLSPGLLSPRSKRKQGSGYDRFIPDRDATSYSNALLLNSKEIFGSPTKKSSARKSVGDTDALREESNRVYTDVLRSELFGAALQERPATSSTSNANGSSAAGAATMTSPRKLLQFRSPNKTLQRLELGNAIKSEIYSLSPITLESQRVLMSPRKTPRHIAKVPFKVLDAPDLADDFYLNLVDWGSSNVLAVGLGTCVYLWSACTSRVTKLCDIGPYDSVTSVNWIQRGTHVAVGTNRGLVQLWDVAKCKKVRSMNGHTARVGTLAWNDHVLSSGGRDRAILHRDVRSSEDFMKKLTGHKQEVCGLKWNSEENLLASGGNDNRLLIWDRMSEIPSMRFNEHTAAVKAIAWSPHQRGILASGGGTADRRIRFWNTLTGTPLQSVDTGSQVCNIAWAKNANEIVSTHGYSQNQVVIWKYPSMQQVAALTGHTYRVLYLAMSPDGQTVATGAGDETLRFWNVFAKSKEKNEEQSALMQSQSIR